MKLDAYHFEVRVLNLKNYFFRYEDEPISLSVQYAKLSLIRFCIRRRLFRLRNDIQRETKILSNKYGTH